MSKLAKGVPSYLISIAGQDCVASAFTPDGALLRARDYAVYENVYVCITRDGKAWADVRPGGHVEFVDLIDNPKKKVRR